MASKKADKPSKKAAAEQDKLALRAIYEQAAADPRFQENNAAIEAQFAALDNELDESA